MLRKKRSLRKYLFYFTFFVATKKVTKKTLFRKKTRSIFWAKAQKISLRQFLRLYRARGRKLPAQVYFLFFFDVRKLIES